MTTTDTRSTDRPQRSDRQVIAYLAFTGILLALGIDIALPAFDEIRPALGLAEGSNRVTQVITVYFLGMGLGQLVWGPVSDRFGRQRAMLTGVGLYVGCAVASALAPSFTVLLLARFIWGLGAAAPTGLRPAIARDLYRGDQMARVMSMVMAIFMIGPILAPLLGEVILSVVSWRYVFVFCALAGAGQMAWTVQFGETLPKDQRQPLEFRTTGRAFVRVVTTRQTIAYTLALAFAYSGFYVYLASTQPIMDTIYGRANQFAIVFGASGILMAGAFVLSNRLFARIGTAATVNASAVVFIALATAQLALVLSAGGTPSFWPWIALVTAANLVGAPLGPAAFTLGLEPMGDLAGTAAGVMGFLSMTIASGLSAIVNSQIDLTVTPMALGYGLFGLLSLLALILAQRPGPKELRNTVDP